MIPLDPLDDFMMGLPHPVERAVPKPSVCAQVLQQMYDDKDARLQMAIGARETAEKMSWDATIPKWDSIFQELLVPQQVTAAGIAVPNKISTMKF